MSERREPGYYVVKVSRDSEYMIAEFDGEFLLMAGTEEWSSVSGVEWGPRILADPTLVQVSREKLEALRKVLRLADELTVAVDAETEDIGGHRPSGRILRELGPAVDKANRLDSLRRREGESDG